MGVENLLFWEWGEIMWQINKGTG